MRKHYKKTNPLFLLTLFAVLFSADKCICGRRRFIYSCGRYYSRCVYAHRRHFDGIGRINVGNRGNRSKNV